MFRVVSSVFSAAVLLGSSAGIAAGESPWQGTPPGGGMTGASSTASPRPETKLVSEPADLSGMLAAQNDSRSRMGVPALIWSEDLTVKAKATVKSVAEGPCSQSSAAQIGRGSNAAIYWVTGLRRFGGADTAQDISPAYLVSRWREGRSEYDIASGMCRTKTPACEPYARMVAPKARAVGCARVVCRNQSQVWACHYSE